MKGMPAKTDGTEGEGSAFRQVRCYIRRTECT